MTNRLLATSALVLATAAGSLASSVAPAAASAAPGSATHGVKCKLPKGAKTVRKHGGSVVYTRNQGSRGIVYYACSTKYGKTVRMAADQGNVENLAFHLGGVDVQRDYAQISYCIETEDSLTKVIATADLKRGKLAEDREEDPEGGC